MGDNDYVVIFNSVLMDLCQKDECLSSTGTTLINQLSDLLGESLCNYIDIYEKSMLSQFDKYASSAVLAYLLCKYSLGHLYTLFMEFLFVKRLMSWIFDRNTPF